MHPRKTYRNLGLLALLALFPAAAFAAPTVKHEAEDMVVTANRSEISREETTKSISVFGSEDRDEQQRYFLPELMDNEPGVFLRRNGGLGQWTNVSIRGAGGQHTQFQYNGMPLRDAADTQSTLQYFVEDMFSGSNLDRVEILKGTNSVLYGSQAMGGVINLIPQKWQSGLAASFRNEIGPDSTYIGNLRMAYGTERWYIDLNPLYVTTDGEDYGGKDSYEYENTGGTFAAGFRPTEDTALELNGLISDTDLTLGSSPSLDALGNIVKNQAQKDRHRESLIAQVGLNWTQRVSALWDYTLKGSYSETERHYFWSATPGDRSNYDGDTWYLEMQHNLHFTDWLTLNLGADYEDVTYEGREPADQYGGDFTPVNTKESWHSGDVFGQGQLAFLDRTLLFNLGTRLNSHEKFDEKAVWELSGAYLFKDVGTKLHAQLATGYRTPSLYEVYGGYVSMGQLITIGNKDLQPEESIGYEIGLDQSLWDGKLQAGLAWFHTDFDDLITFDGFENRYVNAGEAKTEGVEASLKLQPWNWMRLGLAYTYASPKYKNNNREWTRSEYLSRNKLNATLTLYPLDKLTFSLGLRWQDNKIVPLYDPSYNQVRWEEDDVVIVNLAASYRPIDHVEIFARVENLFDKDYTEAAYCMPGMTAYGGVKLTY